MAAVGYHFSAKAVSRSKGQSALASVSYITAEKLHDERIGKTFDYSRKQGVEFVFHAAPKVAPGWAHDIGTAWNAAESAEKKCNATLALNYVVAFPHELNAQQREFIIKDFVREEFTRKGFMATAAIHSPDPDGDERNYHAHIMFSYRPMDENGFAKNKDRYFSGLDTREEALASLKEKFSALTARQLERAGFTVEAARWRHGHEKKSIQYDHALQRGDIDYAEQCIGEATKHLGQLATVIERDGRESFTGNHNRDVAARNAARREITAKIRNTERLLTKLEAAELDQMAAESGQPKTTQYAIDALRDLADAQAASGQIDPEKFGQPAPDDPAAAEAARLEAEEAEFWRMKREQQAEQERSQGHGPEPRR